MLRNKVKNKKVIATFHQSTNSTQNCNLKIETIPGCKGRGFESVLFEVDGGICLETAPEAADAGSDILVSGSSVFKGNIGQNVHDLLKAMNHSENV